MTTYLFIYLGSLFLSVLGTPVVIFIARALNAYDRPGPRKVHAAAIPRIGGVAIVSAMLGVTIPTLLFSQTISAAFHLLHTKIIVLLVTSGGMFLMGLLDDICRLRARTKFAAQIAAALVVCAYGIRIEVFSLAGWFTLQFGWLAWPITVLWIVGVTNAVNLIDGLDGLAAGISAMACGVIAVVALYVGQPVMAVLMFALLGSLSGFLFFNFNPAKIFMGDCGSLFLGFILASASVLCATKTPTLIGLALPALALGIPIFDTLCSILRRFLERRSLFAPDRSHFHHRLLDMGLRHRHVVIFSYLVTLAISGIALMIMATRNQLMAVLVFAAALWLLILIFRLVGVVRLREMITSLKKNFSLAKKSRNHRRDFEIAQLYFRQTATFAQWWRAVQMAAEQMGLISLTLSSRCRSGSPRTLYWQRANTAVLAGQYIQITVPTQQRRHDDLLQITFAVPLDDSLETAGACAALFTRLIDQHNLQNLPAPSLPRLMKPFIAADGLTEELMAPRHPQKLLLPALSKANS